MGEQPGALDHGELGIGERADHLLGPLERQERVLVAPDQLHRDRDLLMQSVEISQVLVVEAAQYADGCIATFRRLVQRPQEELVELAVEQRRVRERGSEHQRVAADPRPTGHPAEPCAESRRVSSGEEQPEPPAQALRLLGVDEAHRAHAWITGDSVPGDHPAAVVPDDSDVVQLEQVQHPPDGRDVLAERQRGVGAESAGATARQVDDVAGDVFGEVGQERPERRPADGPAVNEQHVGSGADRAMGYFAGADVEISVRFATEEVGGCGRGDRGHRASGEEWGSPGSCDPESRGSSVRLVGAAMTCRGRCCGSVAVLAS